MSLPIAQLGQPVLRQVAAEVPVDEIATPDFQAWLREMRETLKEAKGVGLAAPQVFAAKRVFLAAVLPPVKEGDEPGVEVFINPQLTFRGEEKKVAWEGCLSFLELLVKVPRYREVRIDYRDAEGEPRYLDLSGFNARVVQHENDHLDGILILDRVRSSKHIIKASEIETVLEIEEKAREM